MAAKLSYLHSPTNYTFHYETIRERLELQAKLHGQKEVYVFVDPNGERTSITAEDLYTKSMSLAKALVKLGLKKGDTVTTCLDNDLDALLCSMGVICAGGIIVNGMIRQKDGSDVKRTMVKVKSKFLVITPGDNNSNFNACMHFINSINEDSSVSSEVETLKYLISTKPLPKPVPVLRELIREASDGIELPTLETEDTFAYFPTSGSTGESKYVPHTHFRAMITGYQLKEAFDYKDDDVCYNERRMSWIGGFPYSYLHDGLKHVVRSRPIQDMDEHCAFTSRTIIKEKCTVAGLLPAVVIGMVDLAKQSDPAQIPKLKHINTGGYPVASVTMDALGLLTESIGNMYGSTEAAFVSVDRVFNKADFVNHSVGLPLAGVEIKVMNKEGKVVPKGTTGIVYVRSPSLLYRYYDDPVKSSLVLSDTHWMNTDDVGYVGENGKLVVSGRASEIIMQNGIYLYPSQIEAVLKNHPDVRDVIVVSLPNDTYFEVACACLLLKTGRNVTAGEIKEYYDGYLIRPFIEAFSKGEPHFYTIVDEFPKLATGKPDKKELRRMMIETFVQ